MASSPENRIEAALVSEIGALTYIAANSVSVRQDDDMTQVKAKSLVNVDVQKALRLDPYQKYYRSRVELSCTTHIPNDEDDTITENIYSEVNDYVQTLTPSIMNAAVTDADITVDGIVPMENEDYMEENNRVYVVSMDTFYTYTPTT